MARDVEPGAGSSPQKSSSRATPAAVGGIVLGALVGIFALLNSQSVQMHWVVSTTTTPLIVVIALFGLIGFGAGWLFGRRGRGRG